MRQGSKTIPLMGYKISKASCNEFMDISDILSVNLRFTGIERYL